MSNQKEQQNPLVKHVFDGIEEHDNRLPNWWLGILWGTIIFAFGYWFYYHPSKLGPDQRSVYEAEVEAIAKKQAAASPLDDTTLAALANNASVVEQGKAVFAQQCAACHAAEGQGLIGPNLTDKYWLHGGKPVEVHKTIADGVVAKGMPAWGPTLGPDRVKQLTAFVLSIKDSNIPGKAPQGDPVE